MNVELLTKVAEWLEAGAPRVQAPFGRVAGFNMEWVYLDLYPDSTTRAQNHLTDEVRERIMKGEDCGTTCCIAGYAAILTGHTKWADKSFIQYAIEAFDLPREDAMTLCYPQGLSLSSITPAQAALTIRKLIETGEVDWSHVPDDR